MKLRLRSFETKQTLKLEIPNPCTLHHLTQLVSQNLPSSSHTSISFSLNRKDNLTTSSPEESIQSLGITSGDLIYFTTNPNGFSTAPPLPQSPPKSQQSQDSHTPNSNSNKQDETLIPNSELIAESMEIDDDVDSDSEADPKVGKSFSVPGFLRKVFTEELGDNEGLNHKLLCIAIRAVLLESGFVEIDPISKSIKNNNFDIQGNWYLASFHYTLPEIITSGNVETVKIKFQNLGKYCKVYGSLVNGTGVHSVLLDEDKLVPFLNVVWANCGDENTRVSTIQPEKEVFEFWRKTKDALALPLLIDLCEKAGLTLPPCFMQLPTELKLKILELASGVEVAKMSCVCSEMRYLASSDELWEQKYAAEFRNYKWVGTGVERNYKERFGRAWESRKRRRVGRGGGLNIMRRRNPFVGPFGGFPGIIGGDEDLRMFSGPPRFQPMGVPRLGNARLLPNFHL